MRRDPNIKKRLLKRNGDKKHEKTLEKEAQKGRIGYDVGNRKKIGERGT